MTSKTSNTKKSENNEIDFETQDSEVAKWQEWKEKAEETAHKTIPEQIKNLQKEKELNEALIEMCENKIKELGK